MAKTYKYHFIYHIRILVGKHKNYFYIGKRSTNNIDDGYCGSGTKVSRIIKSLRKKGYKDSEIYKRTILAWATCDADAYELESIYADEKIINNKFCLNLKKGGEGGMSCKCFTNEMRENARKNALKINSREDVKYKKRKATHEQRWVNNGIKNKRIKVSELKTFLKNNHGWTCGRTGAAWNKGLRKETDKRVEMISIKRKGQTLSDETCKKISKRKKGQPAWNKGLTKKTDKRVNKYANTSTGKTFVNNGIKCIKIPKESLEEYLATHPDWVHGMLKRKPAA